MSQINVDKIVDTSGGVLAPISSVFRSRIINGAMVIDQRNAGASVTPTTSIYTLDRWSTNLTQASKFSVQQSSTAPTGFNNSLLVTSASAFSVASSDYFALLQNIEGFNTADLMWGTANAKTVTLSFWVRSSLTGTFGGSITNSAINRSYPFTYTINSANTFEYKTVTIAGDTTGTWIGATNGIGVRVWFSLGAGSTYSGTAGAWAGATYTSATGAVSLVGTNGATLYITGVQLEVGTQATSFEYRQYQQELSLCQRYFINWVGSAGVGFPMVGSGSIASGTQASIFVPTPVSLRTTPTVSFSGTVTLTDQTSSPALTSVTTVYGPSSSGFWGVFVASTGSFTLGRAALLYAQNASTNSFSASAEL
jgi:hypothetical protein